MIDRYKISKRSIYNCFLDNIEFDGLVNKHFGSIINRKLDRLDRALINKISHFFEYYVDQVWHFPKEYQHISSQLVWILCLTSIEIAIGNPAYQKHSNGRNTKKKSKGKNTNKKDIFYLFFNNNLDPEMKNNLSKSVEYFKSDNNMTFQRVVKELLNKRHSFIHGGNLINLTDNSTNHFANISSLSRGKYGRKGEIISYSISNEMVYSTTKSSITEYFNTPRLKRIPQQDHRR